GVDAARYGDPSPLCPLLTIHRPNPADGQSQLPKPPTVNPQQAGRTAVAFWCSRTRQNVVTREIGSG
ncbi:MAG TPA: hypothetical protein VFW23_00585, partial [Tepidisphaeraceae bacterium]|nr:hypothetical protein [Tepidisphaeraceae bacterium]